MSKYKDLSGQKFGMLTAFAKIPNANAKQAVWRCRCDCGNECEVKKKQLERGTIRDCGCASQKRLTESDLTGKRFGNLTVVERLTEKNYRCVCDCGNERTHLASSLLSGKATSCGCMRGKRKRRDITGMRSGMVVAIEPTDVVRRANILWRCRCDCGKEFLTEAYKISSGKIQSCGCLRNVHQIKDLTGQRFGRLVAIKRLDEKIGSSFAWYCRCDCGNETKVSTNALLRGSTKSCGCTVKEIVGERARNGKGVADFCHFIDGTSVERIESTKKLRSNNTSGYTGVSNDHGRWRATITFKKKNYYLGTYDKLEQAVLVRQQAENRLFGEFLDWYYAEHPQKKTNRSNEYKESEHTMSEQRPKIEIGYRVGMLTVTEHTEERKSRYTIWRCRCDCGGEIRLDTRCLQRGTIKDCGCVSAVKPGMLDLTDQRFGKLVCLEPYAEKDQRGNTQWLCQCDCGNTCVAALHQLRSGYKKSCGCLSHPPLKDYIDKKFGKLMVIEYAGKRAGMHRWKCICECGNETIVGQTLLQSGKTKSCGCLAHPPKKDLSENIIYKGFLDGTNIGMLEARMTKPPIVSNTSGYNGVYKNAKGFWIAQITFKKRTYYLGSYSDIRDAVRARKKGEEMFEEFLDWYYYEYLPSREKCEIAK